ncbi:MAG: superoxide dismutase, Ni [Patescibacteria group bacterium]
MSQVTRHTLPPAHAHCDVPCGVYETDSMKWAATTCTKLTEKLNNLELPNWSDKKSVLEYQNTTARAISTKEEYAGICKREVLIVWTDYIKPEHLEKWPDLHEKVWKIAKQCSVVKRSVSIDECKKLEEMVHDFAHIFAETKKA